MSADRTAVPIDLNVYKLRKRVPQNRFLQRHLARGTITQAQAEASQAVFDELKESGLLPLTSRTSSE